MSTNDRSDAGTPWMLLVMTALVLAAVVVEAAFIAAPSWLMLVVAMTAVIGGAILTAAYVIHVISGGDAAPTPTLVERPAPEAPREPTALRPAVHV